MRPIDADALYDALYDNEFQTFCPLDEVSGVIAAVPTLDYAPVRHGEWIRVQDRLPEDTQRVLFVPTCNQGSVYVGQYAFVGRDGGVMFAHREGRYKSNYFAKHWMPLPELPKEEV